MTRSFVTRHHSSLLFSFIPQINLSNIQRVASISVRATVFALITGWKRDERLWSGDRLPQRLVNPLSELNRWFRSTVKRTLGEDFFEFDPKTRWIESMGKEEKRRPRARRRGTSLSPSESITRPFYFCARPESRPGVIKLFVSIVPTFHLSSTPILLFPFH